MSEANLITSATAAALVVISGGLYALLFALGNLRGSASLKTGSFIAYGVLVVCALALANGLQLSRGWLLVILVMLVGYLLAPRAIWHLTLGTHANVSVDNSSDGDS